MHLHLDNFDGPLDLLLHLIKVQEMNIFNIPIFVITEQFLTLLKQVPYLDFHVAGEYLAMAAQLIEIKANSLIPILQKKETEPEKLDDIPRDDPRKPLVEALLDYAIMKSAAEFLEKKILLYKEIFPSKEYKRREQEFESFEHPIHGNAFDLVIAFERILLECSTEKWIPKVTVKAQKTTIQQRMLFVKEKILKENLLRVADLILECLSRYDLIVTLMAVLELCKAQHVDCKQEQLFGPIYLFRGKLFDEVEAGFVEPT